MANPFEGRTFAIAGTFARATKVGSKIAIEARGGTVLASPSKKTDFLIAAGKAGAALEKAKKLGVRVLSEEDLERMLEEAGPLTEAQLRAMLG